MEWFSSIVNTSYELWFTSVITLLDFAIAQKYFSDDMGNEEAKALLDLAHDCRKAFDRNNDVSMCVDLHTRMKDLFATIKNADTE